MDNLHSEEIKEIQEEIKFAEKCYEFYDSEMTNVDRKLKSMKQIDKDLEKLQQLPKPKIKENLF